jgi:hypothetical protein
MMGYRDNCPEEAYMSHSDASTPNIERVTKKHEAQLLQLPNVEGIGVGEQEGKPVIKVFVQQKVPEASLQPQEVIPKTLGARREPSHIRVFHGPRESVNLLLIMRI